MEKKEIFTKIEKPESEDNSNEKSEETNYETPFVTGLPTWDLNPPYEVMKRGERS